MSYSVVKAGLFERLETVEGLRVVLKYEPNAIHDAPAVYSILQGFDRTQAGQVTAMRYRTLHRLWIKWQDNAAAETQLDSFVNAIPAAIDADATLGGRLTRGFAEVTVGTAEWRTIGDVMYRTIDIISEVVEKAEYGSGI